MPVFPSSVSMRKPTRLPFSLSSRVKKPVAGWLISWTTFSIKVDFPDRGGPVTRTFMAVTLAPVIKAEAVCLRY